MSHMKVSIRMAVLTVLVSFILVISLVMMYTVSDKFNDKLLDFTIDDIESVVQNCKDEITGSVIKLQDANELLGADSNFVKHIKTSGDDALSAISAITEIRSDITSIRTSVSGVYSNICIFFVNSAQPIAGSLESYNNKKAISDQVGIYNDFGLESKPWHKALMDSGRQMLIFEDESIPQYVFCAQIVKNFVEINEPDLGISLVGIDFESILRKYGSIDNTEFLELMILNNSGEVVCTNSEATDSDIKAFASDYINSSHSRSADSMTNVKIGSEDYYACMYNLDFGLTLVAVIPHEEILIPVRETTRDMYLVFAFVLLAVLVIAVVISALLVRPIKRLSDSMANADGNESLHPKLTSSRIREIDGLYNSYTELTHRIEKLLVTAQNLGEQKKETEFRMLQAQINPHYLYNALDSIAWTALRNGQEDIADMASSLADSFRYNARISEMIIDFGSELEFIANYVKLQERFRNTPIKLQVDVGEDERKCKIPKFMLQPLVENSIIHGLKQTGKPLCIGITAHITDGTLEISISDNGLGFDACKLNRYLDGDNNVFDTDKIGIANIHKRLRNKYGERAGLHYTANSGGGLCAVITLKPEEGETNSEIF